MSNDRSVCIVCGKEYDACFNCNETKNLRPWRTVCDTVECYKIHVILSDYNNGYKTKEQAKEALSNIDYKLDELKESVQKMIKDIVSVNKPKTISSDKKDNKYNKDNKYSYVAKDNKDLNS